MATPDPSASPAMSDRPGSGDELLAGFLEGSAQVQREVRGWVESDALRGVTGSFRR